MPQRSRFTFKTAPLLVALLAALVSAPARAQWPPSGTPVCTALDPQQRQVIQGTANGAILAWEDHRYQTEAHIFAQHVDTTGAINWMIGGVPVCTYSPGNQNTPVIAPDPYGGAFVFWGDDRSPGFDIYAQEVDANGNFIFATNGIPVCTATGVRGDFAAIADLNPGIMVGQYPGAILAWRDDRHSMSTGSDIYVAKVLRNGALPWASDGIELCGANGPQYTPQLVTDGSGSLTGTKGAIVVWTDGRTDANNPDIYAARVAYNGTVPWTAGGVVVCNANGLQGDPHLAYVGGAVIIVWSDGRSPNPGIYAQKLDINGNALWTANGVPVCIVSGSPSNPRIASDGSGGALIAWSDSRSGNYDVYAQHLDTNGNALWPSGGVPVCTATGSQVERDVIGDRSGGVIALWDDYRVSNAPHAYVQHLDTNGNALWATNGVAACSNPASETNSVLTNDPEAGAIVAWVDARQPGGLDTDIYANRVFQAGGILAVPDAKPAMLRVALASANPTRGEARLRVDLPRDADVSADVLDLQGRRVCWLSRDEGRPAGSFELSWDGRSSGGAAAGAGIYFVRVRAGSEASTVRLAVVR